MKKKATQDAKTQVEFKITRLNQKLDTLMSKIERAPSLYDDSVKLEPKLENYNYRVVLIKRYLEELQEIQSILATPENVIHIVPKSTATRQIDKAEFASVEFEGDFVQVIMIQNYPSEEYFLVTLEPLANFS